MNNDKNLHAHIEKNSRDCDGGYWSESVVYPTKDELAEEFTDITFMGRIMGDYACPFNVVSASVEITEHGFHYHENTEEGFVAYEVNWCYCTDCDPSSKFRDFTAEAAGY